jgi:hypothetical protein
MGQRLNGSICLKSSRSRSVPANIPFLHIISVFGGGPFIFRSNYPATQPNWHSSNYQYAIEEERQTKRTKLYLQLLSKAKKYGKTPQYELALIITSLTHIMLVDPTNWCFSLNHRTNVRLK